MTREYPPGPRSALGEPDVDATLAVDDVHLEPDLGRLRLPCEGARWLELPTRDRVGHAGQEVIGDVRRAPDAAWPSVPVDDERQPDDRTDSTAYAGLGLRGYLTNRFLLQAEYRQFVVFTSRDDNEEIDEWTVSFVYFF